MPQTIVSQRAARFEDRITQATSPRGHIAGDTKLTAYALGLLVSPLPKGRSAADTSILQSMKKAQDYVEKHVSDSDLRKLGRSTRYRPLLRATFRLRGVQDAKVGALQAPEAPPSLIPPRERGVPYRYILDWVKQMEFPQNAPRSNQISSPVPSVSQSQAQIYGTSPLSR